MLTFKDLEVLAKQAVRAEKGTSVNFSFKFGLVSMARKSCLLHSQNCFLSDSRYKLSLIFASNCESKTGKTPSILSSLGSRMTFLSNGTPVIG